MTITYGEIKEIIKAYRASREEFARNASTQQADLALIGRGSGPSLYNELSKIEHTNRPIYEALITAIDAIDFRMVENILFAPIPQGALTPKERSLILIRALETALEKHSEWYTYAQSLSKMVKDIPLASTPQSALPPKKRYLLLIRDLETAVETAVETTLETAVETTLKTAVETASKWDIYVRSLNIVESLIKKPKFFHHIDSSYVTKITRNDLEAIVRDTIKKIVHSGRISEAYIEKIIIADINRIVAAYVEKIDNTDIQKLVRANIRKIDIISIKDIVVDYVEKIVEAYVEKIDNTDIENIVSADIENIVSSNIENIVSADIENIGFTYIEIIEGLVLATHQKRLINLFLDKNRLRESFLPRRAEEMQAPTHAEEELPPLRPISPETRASIVLPITHDPHPADPHQQGEGARPAQPADNMGTTYPYIPMRTQPALVRPGQNILWRQPHQEQGYTTQLVMPQPQHPPQRPVQLETATSLTSLQSPRYPEGIQELHLKPAPQPSAHGSQQAPTTQQPQQSVTNDITNIICLPLPTRRPTMGRTSQELNTSSTTNRQADLSLSSYHHQSGPVLPLGTPSAPPPSPTLLRRADSPRLPGPTTLTVAAPLQAQTNNTAEPNATALSSTGSAVGTSFETVPPILSHGTEEVAQELQKSLCRDCGGCHHK
jgi:hypothetical protein